MQTLANADTNTLTINRQLASIVPEGCGEPNDKNDDTPHDTIPTVAHTIRTECITIRCTPSRRAQKIEVVGILAAAG